MRSRMCHLYVRFLPFEARWHLCLHVPRIVSTRNAAGRVLEITLRSLKPATPAGAPVASSVDAKEIKEASAEDQEDESHEAPLSNLLSSDDLALDVWLAPVSAALLSATSSKVRDGLLLYALLPLVQLFPGGLRPLLRTLVADRQAVYSLSIAMSSVVLSCLTIALVE